jgi:hypothetical protein
VGENGVEAHPPEESVLGAIVAVWGMWVMIFNGLVREMEEGGIRERKRMDSKDLFQSLVFFNCTYTRTYYFLCKNTQK